MIGWLKSIFKGITNGFNTLIEGVMTIVESLSALFEWVPELNNFVKGEFLNYIPLAFVSVVSVLMVIFIVKIIIGGDNN